MSDMYEGEGQPVEESVGTVIPGEVVAGQSETPEEMESDPEAEARAMGWVPKEEYKGDPEKWRPADEFVSRGKQILPLLQANLKRTTDRLTKIESEHRAQLEGVRRVSMKALERQREQLISQFEAAKRDAVSLGDVERYEDLNVNQYRAVKQFDEEIAAQINQPVQPSNDFERTVADFASRNPWYRTIPEMTQVAERFSLANGTRNPNLSLEENLKATEAYMRKRYPEAFEGVPEYKPGRMGTSPVEASSSRGMVAGAKRSKGASDLPAAVRAVGEGFVKDGLFKNIEEYAKDYWSQ